MLCGGDGGVIAEAGRPNFPASLLRSPTVADVVEHSSTTNMANNSEYNITSIGNVMIWFGVKCLTLSILDLDFVDLDLGHSSHWSIQLDNGTFFQTYAIQTD